MSAQQFQNLAIVAGAGVLPRLIAQQALASAQNYCVLTVRGMALPWAHHHPHIEFELEKINTAFGKMHKMGIKQVVFAGAMQRPAQFLPWRLEVKTAFQAFALLNGLKKGDDGTLRMFLQMVCDAGFSITKAQDLLPDLLADAGVLTRVKPNAQDHRDMRLAVDVLNSLSRFDLGQGCVIAKRRCLSVESHYGTDAMLQFVSQHHQGKGRRKPRIKPSGVLVKMPKIGQDVRADLPAIGINTIHNVANAGLAGIGVSCTGALLIERDKMIAAANEAGLFIYSMPENDA